MDFVSNSWRKDFVSDIFSRKYRNRKIIDQTLICIPKVS